MTILQTAKVLSKLTGREVNISEFTKQGPVGKNGKSTTEVILKKVESIFKESRKKAVDSAISILKSDHDTKIEALGSKKTLNIKKIAKKIKRQSGIDINVNSVDGLDSLLSELVPILKTKKSDLKKMTNVEKNPKYIKLLGEKTELQKKIDLKIKNDSAKQLQKKKSDLFKTLYKKDIRKEFDITGVKDKQERIQNLQDIYFKNNPHDFVGNELVPIDPSTGKPKIHEDSGTNLTSIKSFEMFLEDRYNKKDTSIKGVNNKSEQGQKKATNSKGKGKLAFEFKSKKEYDEAEDNGKLEGLKEHQIEALEKAYEDLPDTLEDSE